MPQSQHLLDLTDWDGKTFTIKWLDMALGELPADGSRVFFESLCRAGHYYKASVMYKKIEKDGFVNVGLGGIKDRQWIELTTQGADFIATGGYEAQERRDRLDKELQRTNWEATTRHANMAAKISWLAIAVAAAALIWQVIEHFSNH